MKQNSRVITLGKYLQKLYYLGAAIYIQFVNKNNTSLSSQYKRNTLKSASSFIRKGISLSKDEGDLVYEAAFYNLKIELLQLYTRLKFQIKGNLIIETFDKAKDCLNKLKVHRNRKFQLTGYDGYANLIYLHAKYEELKRNFKSAYKLYHSSLNAYRDMHRKFINRENRVIQKKIIIKLRTLKKYKF